MFNPLFNANGGKVQNAIALINGHYNFLINNTGQTNDGKTQHFILNPQGVLANNRHFISFVRQQYQPNGDSTTEGQALIVLGFAYAYLATKNTDYLDAAKKYWQAYVTYYYAGQPIPSTPQRWIANWIVNGKEPVLGDSPLDASAPTHSGFKGALINWVNGVAKIPHGSPFFGEYIDVATFAFDGALAWDSINATVQDINADGSTNWNKKGKQYDMDWMIAWNGDKINWDGDVLGTGFTGADLGTVKLKDTTVNGVHKFNYASVIPVNQGGYMVNRNVVQHNRPVLAILPGDVNQMGNAADAEEWFADACYLMWIITKEDKYKKAMDSVLFTVDEYIKIDSTDMFFRQSKTASTPFTDGISYDFVYPSGTTVAYTRDANGYIIEDIGAAAQNSMEQQSVWFRINQQSRVRTTFGGLGVNGGAVSCRVEVGMSIDKTEDGDVTYGMTLPPSTSLTPKVYDMPFSSFCRITKDNGSEYIVADERSVAPYGGCTASQVFAAGILGVRSAMTIQAKFPNDDAGLDIGFWLLPTRKSTLTSMVYASDGEFNLRFQDDNGWRWYWLLPNTNGAFVVESLDPGNLILSGYQPNHPSDPDPSGPVYNEIEEFSILLENSSDTNLTFSYYCINEVPPSYNEDDGYTMRYRITLQGAEKFKGVVGNCTVINYRDDSLAYTPGVVPFSNIYESGSDQIGAWHGMPYPGYQYPFCFCIESEKFERQLTNMIDFLYDSQVWYTQKFGVVGPGASAYIWNRWDNYKYGTPDTFTMYHWGDGHAWAGYQPRAFFSAARAWQELIYRGKVVPEKLRLYVERWISWVYTFTKASGGITPTEFPSNSLPQPDPNDFTGHMCGLWLAGTITAYMAGCRVDGIRELIEMCYEELARNYVNTGVPNQPMNGSWSPAVRLGTDNGMFFGFWAGEILRGLGLYVMYKTMDLNEPIYKIPS